VDGRVNADKEESKMTNHDRYVTGHELITCHRHGTQYYRHEGGCDDCVSEHESLVEMINERLEKMNIEQLDLLLETLDKLH
jgi:hypothetical protein